MQVGSQQLVDSELQFACRQDGNGARIDSKLYGTTQSQHPAPATPVQAAADRDGSSSTTLFE